MRSNEFRAVFDYDLRWYWKTNRIVLTHSDNIMSIYGGGGDNLMCFFLRHVDLVTVYRLVLYISRQTCRLSNNLSVSSSSSSVFYCDLEKFRWLALSQSLRLLLYIFTGLRKVKLIRPTNMENVFGEYNLVYVLGSLNIHSLAHYKTWFRTRMPENVLHADIGRSALICI